MSPAVAAQSATHPVRDERHAQHRNRDYHRHEGVYAQHDDQGDQGVEHDTREVHPGIAVLGHVVGVIPKSGDRLAGRFRQRVRPRPQQRPVQEVPPQKRQQREPEPDPPAQSARERPQPSGIDDPYQGHQRPHVEARLRLPREGIEEGGRQDPDQDGQQVPQAPDRAIQYQ